MYKFSRATSLPKMNTGQEEGFVRTARVPYRVLYALLFTFIIVIIALLLPRRTRNPAFGNASDVFLIHDDYLLYTYNSTYPLTAPNTIGDVKNFRIGVVADQDKKSKASNTQWFSWFKTGTLSLHPDKTLSVRWDPDMIKIVTRMSEKGRGAELSDLCVFNGRLYTVCDRTGIVFEIANGKLIPWVILQDGDGKVDKGFKGEWMTIKDKQLYIGSIGKVWTSVTGEYLNDRPQYIKVISPTGHVEHRPWAEVYNKMRSSAGIVDPGYIIHESGTWSEIHKKWFFLPRRASHEKYNDVDDEHRATNMFITADEAFTDVHVSTLGELNKYKGFSSFKFLPNSHESIIVAIKSEEIEGKIASYIEAFDLEGRTLMKEEKIADDLKFEGVEFI